MFNSTQPSCIRLCSLKQFSFVKNNLTATNRNLGFVEAEKAAASQSKISIYYLVPLAARLVELGWLLLEQITDHLNCSGRVWRSIWNLESHPCVVADRSSSCPILSPPFISFISRLIAITCQRSTTLRVILIFSWLSRPSKCERVTRGDWIGRWFREIRCFCQASRCWSINTTTT